MATVLLVMRSSGNLKVLGGGLSSHGYDTVGAGAPEDLSRVLAAAPVPDAALVDITGYGTEIWDMCKQLQQSQVPFLVISSPRQRELGNQGLESGAVSVLEKPLVKSSLLRLLAGLTKR